MDFDLMQLFKMEDVNMGIWVKQFNSSNEGKGKVGKNKVILGGSFGIKNFKDLYFLFRNN
jgi:hypothetical protein